MMVFVLWMLKEPGVYFTPWGFREVVAQIQHLAGIEVSLKNAQSCVSFCVSAGGDNNPKIHVAK